MKHFVASFILLALLFNGLSHAQDFETWNLVNDAEGNPMYYENQMIIKFNPNILNQLFIDDPNLIEGPLSSFINPETLNLLIESGYFTEELASLHAWKIHKRMTSIEQVSISRLGDPVPIPAFWSTLLIEWNSAITGLTFEEGLDSLKKFPGVIEYATPNYVLILDAPPTNDPYFVNEEQLGLTPQTTGSNPINKAHININDAWAITAGNVNVENPVKVGIYDTGIDWRHDDLSEDGSNTWAKSRVKDGWDYFNGEHPNTQGSLSSHKPDYEGHGSAVAGIIGAIRNNEIGIAGIAGGDATNTTTPWGAQLYSMKIFNNNSGRPNPNPVIGPLSLVVEAIREGATSISPFPGQTTGYGLDVMNFSWQIPNASTPIGLESLMDVIVYAFRNNVSISVSAGNNQSTRTTYPSSYRDDFLMKVGGSGTDGERYQNNQVPLSGTNFGNNLDFLAPGHNWRLITTLKPNSVDNDAYNTFGYTSGACPHAAGTAALMISYMREQAANATNQLAAEDIEHIIERTADINKGTFGVYDDETGWGLMNAGKALEAIVMPKYKIQHIGALVNYNSAVQVGTNVSLNIVEPISTDINPGATQDIPVGGSGDVYKITHTFNITQPNARGVLDVWPLNSKSTLYWQDPVWSDEIKAGPRVHVSAWTQTAATVEGYIYHIKSPVDVWLPAEAKDLVGTGQMHLSVYSVSPWVNGLVEQPMIEQGRIYPNPNNGSFNLAFNLTQPANVNIVVTDLLGKEIYQQQLSSEKAGKKNIELLLTDLQSGLYICTIVGNNNSTSLKLMINR